MPVIAKRILTLSTNTGDQPVPVEIAAPTGSGKAWRCAFTIGWPRGTQAGYGAGVDSMQALSIALVNIATQLYTSPEHESGKLRWDKPRNGYGFPIVKPLRNLLVGDDKVFDG